MLGAAPTSIPFQLNSNQHQEIDGERTAQLLRAFLR
jgi:hypothetical protein